MFGIFGGKKSILDIDVFQGATDCHSHILYGVDDGIKNQEESLKTLDYYEKTGLKTLWLTPHVMEDVPNSPLELKKRFDELKSVYNGGIELRLSTEHMLDNLFDQRFKEGDILPHVGNNILVETSTWAGPIDFWEKLETIMEGGYFPLLAHPERYNYMDMHDYERLEKMGVRLQLNVPSLLGVYGQKVKAKAEYFLEHDKYICAGTDCHRLRSLEYQFNSRNLKTSTIKKLSKVLHPDFNNL